MRWTTSRLSRHLDGLRDGTHGSFERKAAGIPLLSAKNIQHAGVVTAHESLISAADAATITANGYPARGDVLLTIVGTIGRSAVYEHDTPLPFQRSVAFLRPKPSLDSRFLKYQLSSTFAQDQMALLAKTSAQAGLYLGSIASLLVTIPSLPEQQQIADYLDRETAQIDTLIDAQQQLVETLRERRASVITSAVTKGTDPTAPMADTNVSSLGSVPAHWQILRMKNVGTTVIGLTYSPADIVEADEGGVLVLRAGNVQGGKIALDDCVYVRTEIPENLRLGAGDILICARNGSPRLIGKNALVTDKVAGQTWGAFMVVLRSSENDYLRWVLNSQIFTAQTGLYSTATINQLTSGTLNNLVFALPPADERAAIADFLDEQTAKIDALIVEAKRLIDLSRERRSALITATVTGQIDVRDEVA